MNNLLQDIWHDLRERRLWPIAALLLVGILAIPVVLTESRTEPPATPVAAVPDADTPKGPGVRLDVDNADSSGTGSALNVFAPEDPFVPPKSVTDEPKGDATATAAGPSGDGDAGAGQPGGAPAPGGSQPAPPTTPGAPVPPVAPPKTSEYEYVADVTFWNGDRRRERRLRKLGMLPSQASPVLIFMGATAKGGNAVFLVDSTLKAAGEGNCRPTRANCAFVDIGPGAEHTFKTETGESYRLRVDEIRRVKTRLEAAQAAADPGVRASVASGPSRRFSLPAMTDLVVVTSGGDDRSSNPQEGR
jgi:hypothetical protein